MAFNFLEKSEEGAFSISKYENEDGKKSFTFSGRSAFSQLGIKYEELVKNESLKLSPTIQESNGKRYFIVEIPLKEF
jgi:hypothetical protein